MLFLKSNQIRKLWIDFWKSKNHLYLSSVSLVPQNDNSLLWINSGVSGLKEYFLGVKKFNNTDICNIQKCIRTNDIENIGVTNRHLSFFEMLGNFSINGYFKEKAILWAWEFLTDKKWLSIDKEKLYITVYKNDIKSYNIWTNIVKIKKNKIIMFDKDSNFWDLGSGPCGPNTEIFYDRGISFDKNNLNELLFKNNIENERYLELWNIVFSEFFHYPDNTYQKLKNKNIDTGAGFERICLLLQNKDSVFETDLFWSVIQKLKELSPKKYINENKKHFKIIADHLKTVCLAIGDGVKPDKTKRGYIIRKLIRRAIISALELNIELPFLNKLVDLTIDNMNAFYTYLNEKNNIIKKFIKEEEKKFIKLLATSTKVLTKLKSNNMINEKELFKCSDSFGIPKVIIKKFLDQNNIDFDWEKYDYFLLKQKNLSKKDFKSKNIKKF